jgi:hypothetical protein
MLKKQQEKRQRQSQHKLEFECQAFAQAHSPQTVISWVRIYLAWPLTLHRLTFPRVRFRLQTIIAIGNSS